MQAPPLPFNLAAAVKRLAERDERLKRLIDETPTFRLEIEEMRSPYEALLESIAYQSISGKAAATIFGRIKALGGNGRAPTPAEMLKLRTSVLRKAGLSGAKVLAMKDLARKTLAGVVPTLEQAHEMSDEALIERLVSVRGIGVWSVEMFLIFRLGRPDVLPIHDLGVRKGWSITYGKRRPRARSSSVTARVTLASCVGASTSSNASTSTWSATACGSFVSRRPGVSRRRLPSACST